MSVPFLVQNISESSEKFASRALSCTIVFMCLFIKSIYCLIVQNLQLQRIGTTITRPSIGAVTIGSIINLNYYEPQMNCVRRRSGIKVKVLLGCIPN